MTRDDLRAWLSRSATRRQMLAETVRFLEANNPAGPAD